MYRENTRAGMQAVTTFLKSKIQPKLIPVNDEADRSFDESAGYEDIINYILEDWLTVVTRVLGE